MNSDICIVIPAYNASQTIGDVVARALRHCHVIVADDGSEDNTAQVAGNAGAEVIRIEKNQGKGNALRELFLRAMDAGYSAVITMDADGQHDPDEVPLFLREHERYPDAIIVGSRMKDKDLIPARRYNAMRIARFYISYAANQFIEDTQCGFRLYPLSIIEKINLVTERYVTETEILMKAGDSGYRIRFIPVKAIYDGNRSHFRPVKDIAAITAYVMLYLTIKWTIESVSSGRPFTYKKNGIHDRVARNGFFFLLMQALAVTTAVPFSVWCLLEYIFLSPFIRNNFSSVRQISGNFVTITMATLMLPVVLPVAVFEKAAGLFGLARGVTGRFVSFFYPEVRGYCRKD